MSVSVLHNPHRGTGLAATAELAAGATVLRDAGDALALLRLCPAAAPTPLRDLPTLAAKLNVGALWLKDEAQRMNLGSFKALGAVYAMARLAAERLGWPATPLVPDAMAQALAGEVFACASAGNHGLSVATGARLFGARAVVYLGAGAPEAFARRLREAGAQVERAGADWSASLEVAIREARSNGWILLSDSSWGGYTRWPQRVMQGYLVAGEEAYAQVPATPTHIVLQAGVGGFAAAMAALARHRWGDDPTILVVEPEAAGTLMESIRLGRPARVAGPASVMGRLDCKEPSHLALTELAREADAFVSVSDAMSEATVALLGRHGVATTPSGAAGLSALHHVGRHRGALGLGARSRVLAFITEGPEDRP